MSQLIIPGIYMHYKGNKYEVIGTAKHSETEEDLVLYFPIKSPGQLWVRPLHMFCEVIELDGKKTQRFAKID